jgi:hypothetical protein
MDDTLAPRPARPSLHPTRAPRGVRHLRAAWRGRPGALLALSLALILCAPPARAQVAPEARPVLDRYLQAMGGPALLAVRAVHTVATVEAFSMKGSTETWSVRPDHYLMRFAIGPISMRMGYDGTTGWRTDTNGKILRLDGKDLDEAKGSTWFDSDGFLLPDGGGGRVAWVGEESDSLGRYAVLDITPPVGRARRVYFDATSGLLAKTVSKNDEQTVVTRYLDYRSTGGRQVAWKTTTEIVGQPMNTFRLTVDSVSVNPEIPAGMFAMPAEAGEGVTYLKTPGVARLPFEYRARHVWLKASVNGGPPEDFIFDTGASITVIDSAYAARIGLKTEGLQQGQGAGAMGSASLAALQSLRVAAPDGDGIEQKDVKVAVLSLNGMLAPFFWRDCAGIIGFDFIDRFVDEIDYDARTLVLHDPKTFQYAGKGSAVPMTLAGHTPVVTMKLDGAYEGGFRVDVGSGSTVDLHGPFVKKNGLVGKVGRSVETLGGGFGGTFSTRTTRMHSLEIGPFSCADPVVSLSEATTGAFASEDYAGNIGNRLLERFKVTIDYERRQLWLEPGKLYARRDPFTRAGIQLGRTADTVKVMYVLKSSPAEEAGLRVGDVVVALDGTPVASLTPDSISEVLDEGPPGRHTFDIVREGKPRKVSVRLKEML